MRKTAQQTAQQEYAKFPRYKQRLILWAACMLENLAEGWKCEKDLDYRDRHRRVTREGIVHFVNDYSLRDMEIPQAQARFVTRAAVERAVDWLLAQSEVDRYQAVDGFTYRLNDATARALATRRGADKMRYLLTDELEKVLAEEADEERARTSVWCVEVKASGIAEGLSATFTGRSANVRTAAILATTGVSRFDVGGWTISGSQQVTGCGIDELKAALRRIENRVRQ